MPSSDPTNPDTDDDAAPGAGGSQGFARLVDVLQAPPAPPRRRRVRTAPGADEAVAAESCEDALLRAEQFSRGGRIAEALVIAEALRPALQEAADPAQLGRLEFVFLLSHQNAGRSKDAVIAGYRAIDWQSRTCEPEPLLRTLALLATAVARIGDAGGALELLERARELLPSVEGMLRPQCIFWTNSGATHHALGNLELARDASAQAVELAARFDDPELRAVCTTNLLVQRLDLAVRACGGQETALVRELFAACRAHVDELVSTSLHYPVAKGAEDIADSLVAVGRVDAAREMLRIGIRSAEFAKAGPDRGVLELRLARIERLAGQYRPASAHLAFALDLLAQGEVLKELADAHLENSLLHEAQQRWRAALDSYRRSAEIRERLLVAQSDARAQSLTMRLELERSRREARSLRTRNEALENDLRRLGGR